MVFVNRWFIRFSPESGANIEIELCWAFKKAGKMSPMSQLDNSNGLTSEDEPPFEWSECWPTGTQDAGVLVLARPLTGFVLRAMSLHLPNLLLCSCLRISLPHHCYRVSHSSSRLSLECLMILPSLFLAHIQDRGDGSLWMEAWRRLVDMDVTVGRSFNQGIARCQPQVVSPLHPHQRNPLTGCWCSWEQWSRHISTFTPFSALVSPVFPSAVFGFLVQCHWLISRLTSSRFLL